MLPMESQNYWRGQEWGQGEAPSPHTTHPFPLAVSHSPYLRWLWNSSWQLNKLLDQTWPTQTEIYSPIIKEGMCDDCNTPRPLIGLQYYCSIHAIPATLFCTFIFFSSGVEASSILVSVFKNNNERYLETSRIPQTLCLTPWISDFVEQT